MAGEGRTRFGARRRSSKRARALRVALLPVVLFLGVIPLRVQAVATTDPRLPVERTWAPSVVPPDWDPGPAGSLEAAPVIADSARRTIWMVEKSWIVTYDLDSLAPTARPLTSWNPGSLTAISLDDQTGQLILGLLGGSATVAGPVPPGVPSIELLSKAGSSIAVTTTIDLGAAQHGRRILGLSENPDGRFLYVLTGLDSSAGVPSINSPTSPGLDLLQVDLTRPMPAVTWTHVVPPACLEVPGERVVDDALRSFGYDARSQSVYMVCTTTGISFNPPTLHGVGRIRLGPAQAAPASGALDLYPVPGNPEMSTTVFDPVNSRLVFSYSAASVGHKITVFDTASDGYLGDIDTGLNTPTSMAVDDSTARVYAYLMQSGPGLVVSDIIKPPTQPYADSSIVQYSSYGPRANVAATFADTVKHRIFVSGQDKNGYFYVVVRDTAPPLPPLSAGDADRNTTDIAEHEGITDRTFNGAAQGYGALYDQVGGIGGLFGTTGLSPNVVSNDISGDVQGISSYLQTLNLNLDAAQALAFSAQRDRQWTAEQEAIACGSSPQQLQGAVCPWPYPPAACTSFAKATQGSGNGPNGTSTVSCDPDRHRVSAQASMHGVGGSGDTALTASVQEVDKVGTVTEVTSEARNVSLVDGALSIGRVAVTARAWAGGHPGSAGTSLTRTVENVMLDGTELCTTNCDLSKLSQQIAVAFDNRVQVTFPNPDQELAAGSPGGYVAGIRRDPSQHYDDVARNNWDGDRWEMPGMEIIEYNDTYGPTRTDVRLAGVEVEARYGIYPLGQYLADHAGSSSQSLPPPATGNLDSATPPLGDTEAGSLGGPSTSGAPATTAPQTILAGLPAWHGWRWLLQHPGLALRFAATWLLLLLPVHLAARRWMLIRRQTVLVES